ncbi:MAG: 4-hydroxybenzoate octaprenyltransferase [Alphaproteobacteria bacterium]|nr:4-hydroxybenzoate octaprenyltransferase [Alphaproteobacteria bacterium]
MAAIEHVAGHAHDGGMSEAIPATGHTDINRTHWMLRILPARARPYGRLARWDRPIGIWLLLFPCWWSIALCAPLPAPDSPSHVDGPGDWASFAWFMLAFAIGAFAMRGAGCTWNDILDRHIDAHVERTRDRPLPAGEVTVGQALAWLAAQAAVGAAILFSFNLFAIAVGLASLLIVAIYPLMKRITSWPQVVLGFAFNWGALLGWAAVGADRPCLAYAALSLYLAGVAWTLVYDTIYAMQDQRDDAIIGVRSTARRFQAQPQAWLTLFAVLTVIGLALAGWLARIGGVYYVGLAAVAAHLAWQVATVKPRDPADCLHKFRANRWIGWLLLAGILAGRLL